jgi:hypothetical protein
LKDFRKFSRDVGYNILKEISISTNPANSEGSVIRYFTDLRATYGIYMIEKIRK